MWRTFIASKSIAKFKYENQLKKNPNYCKILPDRAEVSRFVQMVDLIVEEL